MRRLMKMVAAGTIAVSLAGGAAIAQDHHDDQEHHDQRDRHDQRDHHDHYVRHDDWRRGQHIRRDDWDRGERVDDWQARHLRRPPRGYEWREVDGQYVMANSGGVIFSVVIPR